MAEVFRLQGVIEILTGKASKELTNLGSRVQGVGQQMDKVAGALGRISLTVAGFAAPFAVASAQAATFEAAMRDANTIARRSEEDFQGMSEQLRTLSQEFGLATTPVQNAAAIYDIFSAGITDVAQAQETLVIASKAATAGITETAVAADAITSIMNAYGSEVVTAQQASDVLFKTVELGKVRFEDLAQGLGQSLGLAANAGVSIEELGAVVAQLTAKGIPARRAMTALAAILRKLSTPGDAAKEAMAGLGIEINQQTLSQKGLIATLQELSAATDGSADSISKVVEEGIAVNAILSLTSDGGDALAGSFVKLQSAAGATEAAFAEQAKTVKFAGQQFKAAFQAAGIAVGTVLAPMVKSILDFGTSVINVFNDMSEPARTLAVIVGLVGAAIGATIAIIPPAVIAVGALAKAYKDLGLSALFAKGAIGKAAVTSGTAAVAHGTSAVAMSAAARAANGLAGGTAAAGAAAGGASIGFGALLGPILLGVIAVGALSKAWIDAKNEQIEAEKNSKAVTAEIARSTARMKEFSRAVDEFKGKTPEALADAGVSALDLTKGILAAREALETLNDEQIRNGKLTDGQAKKRRELIDLVQELTGNRTELLAIEKAELETGAKLTESERDRFKTLTKAEADFRMLQEKGIFETKQQELRALDELANKLNELPVAFRAQLQAIAVERIKLSRDAGDEVVKETKRALEEERKAEIAAVDNRLAARKITKTQAIAGLREILKTKELTADQEIAIERKIAAMTGQVIDERIRKTEKLANERKTKAQEASQIIQSALKAEASALKSQADGLQTQVDRLVERGAAEEDINAVLERRAGILKDIAKKEAFAAKEGAKGARERKAIEDQLASDLKNIDAETADSKKEAGKKALEEKNDELDRVGSLQNKLRDNERTRLDQSAQDLASAGRLTTEKRKDVLGQQLKLRLANIAEERRQAMAAAQAENASAQEQALLRRDFEFQKQQAIRETKMALKELDKAQKESSGVTFKGVQTFEEAIADMQKFGDTFGQSAFAAEGASKDLGSALGGLPGFTNETDGGATGTPGITDLGGATGGGGPKIDVKTEFEATLNIKVDGEIELVDSDGLSEDTALDVVADLGLEAAILGQKQANLGQT